MNRIQPQELLNQRYEIKYFIENLTKPQLQSHIKLNPAMFKEIFYKRYVNNIYFDSISMKNYYDNTDGATYRSKYRVRWYGDMLGNIERPIFEIKSKCGLVGTKQSFPLLPFKIGDDTFLESFTVSVQNSIIPEELREIIKSSIPTLLNRYSRQYYLSADKLFRSTIDFDQLFIGISRENNSFYKRYHDRQNSIIELKYDKKNSGGAHVITNGFPFRVTKSSKYVRGIEHILF